MHPHSQILKLNSRHTAFQASKSDASHPLDINEKSVIFAPDKTGRPYIQGWATIISKDPRPHHYRVRFDYERGTKVRFINPDWPKKPATSFALLVAFWRANGSSASFEDFFPEEDS